MNTMDKGQFALCMLAAVGMATLIFVAVAVAHYEITGCVMRDDCHAPPAPRITYNADGSWDIPSMSGLGPTIDYEVRQFRMRDGSVCDNVWNDDGHKTGLHCYRSK